jgi:hypothetical protein
MVGGGGETASFAGKDRALTGVTDGKKVNNPHEIQVSDKGYGVAEGAKLKKVVEMFDPQGRPVSDPTQASRYVTSYYDGDRLVKRVLGKAMIMGAQGPNEPDD